MPIRTLTIKTISCVLSVKDCDNVECQPEIEINHTFRIELEGDKYNPTFKMPEDIDKDQQTLISRAVDFYLENEYEADEPEMDEDDIAYNNREDYNDSIRKYGHE